MADTRTGAMGEFREALDEFRLACRHDTERYATGLRTRRTRTRIEQLYADLLAENERLREGDPRFQNDRPLCSNCDRRIVFEFTVESRIWNDIVRREGPETENEYLCLWCFAERAREHWKRDEDIPVGVNLRIGKVITAWCESDLPTAYRRERGDTP